MDVSLIGVLTPAEARVELRFSGNRTTLKQLT